MFSISLNPNILLPYPITSGDYCIQRCYYIDRDRVYGFAKWVQHNKDD